MQSQHLESFLPFILKTLTSESSDDKSTTLKIEGLHTLTQIVQLYKVKKQHIEMVSRAVTVLLDDRKRIVRKFARNCINEW